jgi:hypothetical protein
MTDRPWPWSVELQRLLRVALTIWLSRLAAPRPVGPAPMTRTSTDLSRSGLSRREVNRKDSLQVRHLALNSSDFQSRVNHKERPKRMKQKERPANSICKGEGVLK